MLLVATPVSQLTARPGGLSSQSRRVVWPPGPRTPACPAPDRIGCGDFFQFAGAVALSVEL
jgi:hypothetical protein